MSADLVAVKKLLRTLNFSATCAACSLTTQDLNTSQTSITSSAKWPNDFSRSGVRMMACTSSCKSSFLGAPLKMRVTLSMKVIGSLAVSSHSGYFATIASFSSNNFSKSSGASLPRFRMSKHSNRKPIEQTRKSTKLAKWSPTGCDSLAPSAAWFCSNEIAWVMLSSSSAKGNSLSTVCSCAAETIDKLSSVAGSTDRTFDSDSTVSTDS
mmetsp:Transcript_24577/g.56694  ORF Transcript_24577/g.56694 Transcript_24577/m.56694 type:complete len:210 (-) Transcript_24577:609-1238(-)